MRGHPRVVILHNLLRRPRVVINLHLIKVSVKIKIARRRSGTNGTASGIYNATGCRRHSLLNPVHKKRTFCLS